MIGIKNLTQTIFKDNGFSLIEVLVAILILTLIVFAFTPLLLSSLRNIYYAGDKSEALYEGQSELEVSIAEQITDGAGELVFHFEGDENYDDVTIKVSGGIVDILKTKTGSEATAWLSGYVPFIPSLQLDPSLFTEGYQESTVEAIVKDAPPGALEDANDKYLTIYDVQNFEVSKPIYTVCSNGNNYECAEFTLQKGLTNSKSPYLATLALDLQDGNDTIEIFLQARLQVVLPYAVAVGSGQTIFISPDAREIWNDRPHNAMGTGTFNDITWTGFEFIAISSSNRIISWSDRKEPFEVYNSSSSLNSVDSGSGRIVVVGDGGYVNTSGKVDQWDSGFTVSEANGNTLWSVGWSDTMGEFVAVGSEGTIIASSDGLNWNNKSPEGVEDVNFYGVASFNSNWLAVGENTEGKIAYLSAGGNNNWEKIDNINGIGRLNSVIADDEGFVIVGDNGSVYLLSNNDSNWGEGVDVITMNSGTSNTLHAVDWARFGSDDSYYIASGNDGTIITWDGISENWSSVTTSIDQNLRGVAIRWSP